MGPVGGHRFAVATFALGDFVFVVGEHQVEPATVDVERFAQQFAAHRGALDVPARSTFAPGAVPGGFARLGRFPEGKVGQRAFECRRVAAFALHRVDAAIRELAIAGVPGHVEINVAFRFVRVTFLDERLDEPDDILHAIGRTGKMVNLIDAQRCQIAVVVGDVLLGDL